MEAKLKLNEYNCFKKIYSATVRKEESREVVVPDTMPDIAEIMFCPGTTFIRSKDLGSGRVEVEANVPVRVFYRAENGELCSMEVSLPILICAESEDICGEGTATAELKPLSIEAKALNPRKLLVRAEISAEICVYEESKIVCTEGTEEEEHIHLRSVDRRISLVSAVTEKTFALADEISLPPAAGSAGEVLFLGCESAVDEVKSVGSKLIVKGRVKSRLVMFGDEGQLCHLEPVTDFSQIIELGSEQTGLLHRLWLTPSGAFCQISPENEGRIGIEINMVAQLVCFSEICVPLADSAYSNVYELQTEYESVPVESVGLLANCRESFRVLFETARPASEVLYSGFNIGKSSFEDGKMLLNILLYALCSGAEGLWCEKRRTQLGFRVPETAGKAELKDVEIREFVLLPVPGGLELRAEAEAEIWNFAVKEITQISAISYDGECKKDNSGKPSIVLVRLREGDELWELARENCSSVEAILCANGISGPEEAIGKLILIPKNG